MDSGRLCLNCSGVRKFHRSTLYRCWPCCTICITLQTVRSVSRLRRLFTRYAPAVVQLLQWHNQGKLAVEYAYRLLRSHYAEVEAHKAYLGSFMAELRPVDIPVSMDNVQIGSAVQYSEGGSGAVRWFVIEDTDNTSDEFEEVSAKSDIAREVLGKKVGDGFVLAKSAFQDRTGTIVQILSKYTRRFQAIGEQMQLKFGAESVIQTMYVPPPDKLTVADLQPMLDSVKARSEAVAKLKELYKSTLLTVLHRRGGQGGFQEAGRLSRTDDRPPGDGRWMPDGF